MDPQSSLRDGTSPALDERLEGGGSPLSPLTHPDRRTFNKIVGTLVTTPLKVGALESSEPSSVLSAIARATAPERAAFCRKLINCLFGIKAEMGKLEEVYSRIENEPFSYAAKNLKESGLTDRRNDVLIGNALRYADPETVSQDSRKALQAVASLKNLRDQLASDEIFLELKEKLAQILPHCERMAADLLVTRSRSLLETLKGESAECAGIDVQGAMRGDLIEELEKALEIFDNRTIESDPRKIYEGSSIRALLETIIGIEECIDEVGNTAHRHRELIKAFINEAESEILSTLGMTPEATQLMKKAFPYYASSLVEILFEEHSAGLRQPLRFASDGSDLPRVCANAFDDSFDAYADQVRDSLATHLFRTRAFRTTVAELAESDPVVRESLHNIRAQIERGTSPVDTGLEIYDVDDPLVNSCDLREDQKLKPERTRPAFVVFPKVGFSDLADNKGTLEWTLLETDRTVDRGVEPVEQEVVLGGDLRWKSVKPTGADEVLFIASDTLIRFSLVTDSGAETRQALAPGDLLMVPGGTKSLRLSSGLEISSRARARKYQLVQNSLSPQQ